MVRGWGTQPVPGCLNCGKCCGRKPVGEEMGAVRNLTSHEVLRSISWLFPVLEEFFPGRERRSPIFPGTACTVCLIPQTY